MGWTISDEVEIEGEAGASMFLKDQQRGDLGTEREGGLVGVRGEDADVEERS